MNPPRSCPAWILVAAIATPASADRLYTYTRFSPPSLTTGLMVIDRESGARHLVLPGSAPGFPAGPSSRPGEPNRLYVVTTLTPASTTLEFSRFDLERYTVEPLFRVTASELGYSGYTVQAFDVEVDPADPSQAAVFALAARLSPFDLLGVLFWVDLESGIPVGPKYEYREPSPSPLYSLAYPHSLAYSPSGNRLYALANQFFHASLRKIDLDTGEMFEIGPIAIPNITGISFDGSGEDLYAIGADLHRISKRTGEILETIDLDGGGVGGGGLAFLPAPERFTGLGQPDPFFGVFGPRDVSADGSTVVGWGVDANEENIGAFRWNRTLSRLALGMLPLPGGCTGTAEGVSGDGSLIVGKCTTGASVPVPFRWTEEEGMVDLGGLPGAWQSFATSVSADGSTIVGSSRFGSEAMMAWRWTETAGFEVLGDLPGGRDWSAAEDVSADGSVVVGRSSSAAGDVAFVWTAATGIEPLGDLSPGQLESTAHAVSADGTVVVGSAFRRLSIEEAFRWTRAGGLESLGPGGALELSGDGSVIVGRGPGLVLGMGPVAVIWDEARGGRRLLEDVLQELHVDFAGWSLQQARAISVDGKTIAGTGLHVFNTEGWVVALPDERVVAIDVAPGIEDLEVDLTKPGLLAVALLGSEELDVTEVDPTTLRVGPAGARPTTKKGAIADVDGDGNDDLTFQYRVEKTGIAAGDVELCLRARTFDGTILAGCDAIRTLPACGLGFEVALLVGPILLVRHRRRPR